MELAAFTYHHTKILTSAVSEVSSQAPGDVIKGIVTTLQPLLILHPFQRRELDGFERAPSCSSMDEFGLIEAIDRLGESVVVGTLWSRNNSILHKRLNPFRRGK
jgi:hypothetical protein